MRSIGEQREAIEQKRAHQFCNEKNGRERQSDSKPSGAGPRAMIVASVSPVILSVIFAHATASL
jgi:hypothetical protein